MTSDTKQAPAKAPQENPIVVRSRAIKGLLDSMAPQLSVALQKSIPTDLWLRVALTTIRKSPKLLECSDTSLLASLIEVAQLRLTLDGALGQAYLVPYRDKHSKTGESRCQMIIGYRGLVELAKRSGEIEHIYADVVYENDAFRVSSGLNRDLVHEPLLTGERGKITHFYAVAVFKTGFRDFVYMSEAEVQAIRRRSRAADAGPWVTDFPEMGKKTAVRRLGKMLRLKPEDAHAIAADDDQFEREVESVVVKDAKPIARATPIALPPMPEPEEDPMPEEVKEEEAPMSGTVLDADENQRLDLLARWDEIRVGLNAKQFKECLQAGDVVIINNETALEPLKAVVAKAEELL